MQYANPCYSSKKVNKLKDFALFLYLYFLAFLTNCHEQVYVRQLAFVKEGRLIRLNIIYTWFFENWATKTCQCLALIGNLMPLFTEKVKSHLKKKLLLERVDK